MFAINTDIHNWSPPKAMTPDRVSDLQFWMDSADANSVTLAYQTATETVSGTSGTTVLTASATMARIAKAGMSIRVNSADVYTVSSIRGTTINTVENLTSTYAALTSLEVAKSPSQFNDKSGNTRHVTQGTSSLQSVHGIKTIGGKAINELDGIDDYMDGDATFLANTEYTVFVAAKANNLPSNSWILGGSAGVADGNFYCGYSNSAQITLGHFGRNLDVAVTSGYGLQDRVLTFQLNSVGKLIRGDGVELGSDLDPTYLISNAGFKIGQALTITPFNGSVNEVIIYNRALTTAEMQHVENYLMNKWKYNFADIINNKAVLNLDASDLSTLWEASSSLSQWDDTTDFAHNVAQATGIDQPITGVTTQNGKNVVDFDGTNSFMSRSDALGFTGSAGGTVFVVAKPEQALIDSDVIAFGNLIRTANRVRRLDMNTSSSLSGYRFNDGNRIFNSPFDGTFQVSAWLWADGARYDAHELYVNGVIQTQNATANGAFVPNLDNEVFYVGESLTAATERFYGSIGEVIVFDEDLGDNDRSIMDSHVSGKWGT